MSSQRIFLIDDEKDQIKVMKDLLQDQGYQVEGTSKPLEGVEQVKENPPDLLLLDIRMPKMDGYEVCKTLRNFPRTKELPIIIVSLHNQEADVVAGLELGADDYINKPIRERELVARVKAMLRRKKVEPEPEILVAEPLRLDLKTYKATLEGEELTLSPKEFQMLVLFIKREGQVLTRGTISQLVWGIDHVPTSRTINTHVDKLRRKFGRFRDMIQSLKGVGYRFETIED